ncbi:MAG: hypothetical protein ACFCUE_07085 [Candidatus Bathyarchaeia archaeon]|jgi:hypothetical protein
MKGKIAIVLTISLVLITVLFYHVVNIQNNRLLSNGDTFIYDRFYIWESNDPIITIPSNAYFIINNNSVITLKITNISTQIVNAQITTKLHNGTETIENISVNIKTGENNPTTNFLGDTLLDKSINLIQTCVANVNYTQTREFKDIQREVKIYYVTNQGQTIFKWGPGLFDNLLYPVNEIKEICYDAKTGMFLQYYTKLFMHNQNDINLNATIQQFINIRTDNLS